MSVTRAKNTPPWMKALGWVVSGLCFIVGFYHTGLGLSEFQIFSSTYGSFFVSFVVLACLVMAYKRAIDGSEIGLTFYMFFALVNLICNFNYFYPSYMADSLVRSEIANDKKSFSQLSEEIRANFLDSKLDGFAKTVEEKSKEVQAQIRAGGLGPKADKDLQDIEGLLNKRITRIKSGANQQAWDKTAEEYGRLIGDMLNAKLMENDYGSKHDLVRDAEQLKDLLFRKLDKLTDSSVSITVIPVEVKDLVGKYRDLCVRANRLSNPPNGFLCDPYFYSENADLYKFSHTFRSAVHHLNEAGTWMILFACLLLDFGFPLGVYFLLREDGHSRQALGRRRFWESNDPKSL